MKYVYFVAILIPISFLANAKVDTAFIYSKSMNKTFKTVVITPKKYKKQKAYPSIYLLHGYAGSYSNWIIKAPFLQDLSTLYETIIVCPDGGFSSWYFDSPIDTTMKFKTFIGEEVVDYIDNHYATIKDKLARAITGLSMGGHGALYIAYSFNNKFGVCGSMSGGVDLFASKAKFDIAKRIGDTLKYRDNWVQLSALNFLSHLKKDSGLKMIIDCGIDDYFYEANLQLHQILIAHQIPHEFIIRPGAHNWDYWTDSIKYHFLFFKSFF